MTLNGPEYVSNSKICTFILGNGLESLLFMIIKYSSVSFRIATVSNDKKYLSLEKKNQHDNYLNKNYISSNENYVSLLLNKILDYFY